MTRDLAPRPRTALTNRNQRLGFLPTLSYWNDRERQRLLTPLVLVVAVPLAPLVVVGATKLQLSIWLVYLVLFVVAPTLIMGLVERHIRKELHRRIASGAVDDIVVAAPPQVSNRALPLALLLISVLVVGWAVANSFWLAIGLGAAVTLMWLIAPFARRNLLRLKRATPPAALGEGEDR